MVTLKEPQYSTLLNLPFHPIQEASSLGCMAPHHHQSQCQERQMHRFHRRCHLCARRPLSPLYG